MPSADPDTVLSRDECLDLLDRAENGWLVLRRGQAHLAVPVRHRLGNGALLVLPDPACMVGRSDVEDLVAVGVDGVSDDGSRWWIRVAGRVDLADSADGPALDVRLDVVTGYRTRRGDAGGTTTAPTLRAVEHRDEESDHD
ncbi:hypothetical protein [Pseudonocardia alni]|uniref:hypothetical protein n=1 Tax=Pseudonocardia alni TaxID=33907 RepID=UPI0033DFE89E